MFSNEITTTQSLLRVCTDSESLPPAAHHKRVACQRCGAANSSFDKPQSHTPTKSRRVGSWRVMSILFVTKNFDFESGSLSSFNVEADHRHL
jgi:hypothetical protein